MALQELTGAFKEVGKVTDDLHHSGEERDSTLTERLRIDMSSDNKLSKMIRPLTLLILLFFELLIIIGSLFGATIDVAITVQIGTLLGAAIGFYFESKRKERVAEKNAAANLKIEEMKTKASIKEEKRDARHERKQERRNR